MKKSACSSLIKPAPSRLLQRKWRYPTHDRRAPAEAPPIVSEVLRSPGQTLGRKTRRFMEARLGHDFSRVRVHSDRKAAESARAVDAVAYTVGQRVVFGTGQLVPGSPESERLLAHELVHTIQQRTGNSTRAEPGDLALDSPDNALEGEAERLAELALSGGAAGAARPVQRPSRPLLQRRKARPAARTRRPAPPAKIPRPARPVLRPRGTNPASCLKPICKRIKKARTRTKKHADLKKWVVKWRDAALACVRRTAKSSNASHWAKILKNNEDELRAEARSIENTLGGVGSSARDRRHFMVKLYDLCERKQGEAEIEFHYNVVLESPVGGLQWGVAPAWLSRVAAALSYLPQMATWVSRVLIRFRRGFCHPEDVDPKTGACRYRIGGEASPTGEITVYRAGLLSQPLRRWAALDIPGTTGTLLHEVGHEVLYHQVSAQARKRFFDQIMGWKTYSWSWINTVPGPNTYASWKAERHRLCNELGFFARGKQCDEARLTTWLRSIRMNQPVPEGRRTYLRYDQDPHYLQSVRTASLPKGKEFEYARTSRRDYFAELYTLALTRPRFLHSALPKEQIIWLKQEVFRTPTTSQELARDIALREPMATEFLRRGATLFTWEQLDRLLQEVLTRFQGSTSAGGTASPSAQV